MAHTPRSRVGSRGGTQAVRTSDNSWRKRAALSPRMGVQSVTDRPARRTIPARLRTSAAAIADSNTLQSRFARKIHHSRQAPITSTGRLSCLRAHRSSQATAPDAAPRRGAAVCYERCRPMTKWVSSCSPSLSATAMSCMSLRACGRVGDERARHGALDRLAHVLVDVAQARGLVISAPTSGCAGYWLAHIWSSRCSSAARRSARAGGRGVNAGSSDWKCSVAVCDSTIEPGGGVSRPHAPSM